MMNDFIPALEWRLVEVPAEFKQKYPKYVSHCGHFASMRPSKGDGLVMNLNNNMSVISSNGIRGTKRRAKKKHVARLSYCRSIMNGRLVSKSMSVHRLVAKAFHPNPDPTCTEVDHLDGNKFNNRADNLEWVTTEENRRRCDANVGRVLPLYDRIKYRAPVKNVDVYFYRSQSMAETRNQKQ